MLTAGPAAALVATAAAMLLWPRAGESVRARAHRITRTPESESVRRDKPATPRRRWALAGAAGVASALLFGGGWGLALGFVVAAGAERLLRPRAPDDPRIVQAALMRDLPGACDLLAVCLAAGVPVGSALAAVGVAVPAPLGPHLTAVAGQYRMGAEPRRAWAAGPEALAGLGRVLVRAGESGSAVAPVLRALAADWRAESRAATEAAVRRAGVWILAPLGLCFLPAFICLGVVPLVLGIAADVFG